MSKTTTFLAGLGSKSRAGTRSGWIRVHWGCWTRIQGLKLHYNFLKSMKSLQKVSIFNFFTSCGKNAEPKDGLIFVSKCGNLKLRIRSQT